MRYFSNIGRHPCYRTCISIFCFTFETFDSDLNNEIKRPHIPRVSCVYKKLKRGLRCVTDLKGGGGEKFGEGGGRVVISISLIRWLHK